MAHIYMRFDFADEETAQLARHKLEVWKQAFRLDKKLLYKFERNEEATPAEEPEEATEATSAPKTKTKGKAGAKSASSKSAGKDDANVQLLVRLGFSGHEKITENRWVERIPTEEPFVSASPVTVKTNDAQFEETEKRFEDLE
jgi:hypothetical protein